MSRSARLRTVVASFLPLVAACASNGHDTAPSQTTTDGGPGGSVTPPSDATAPATHDGSTADVTVVDGTGGGPGGDSGAPLVGDSGARGEAGVVGPGSYALPAPKQCDNQNYVPGCIQGMASSPCGGVCSSQSACESTKPNNPDIGFICPRFILFGDEMLQAAKDDWQAAAPPFNYAIVGHDQDTGGIDGNVGTCCQCYELVFDRPSPTMDNEACVNAMCDQGSAVQVPPPMIVQAFDFGATTTTFDIFMGAGGFGGNNACDPHGNPQSQSGKYLYTSFPDAGEPSGGGVKVVLQDPPWPADCKTSQNWLTDATLGSPACQAAVTAQCTMTQANAAIVANETIRSCEGADAPSTFYHLNWQVYAKKVECPAHLTQVTGCELAPQGLPAPQTGITAAQASADPTWRVYGTTTMQDCCKPSCAVQDNVAGMGLTPVGQYNSFYMCDANGVPYTE